MAAPELDRFLTYRLHRVAKISDRDSAAAYQAECGLSLSEGRCLAAVGQFEPASVKDLARLANLDKANASRAADALVERGLVAKAASSTDGRGVALSLTRDRAHAVAARDEADRAPQRPGLRRASTAAELPGAGRDARPAGGACRCRARVSW
jgi:DNA-binding MarR family transcriptional regulator